MEDLDGVSILRIEQDVVASDGVDPLRWLRAQERRVEGLRGRSRGGGGGGGAVGTGRGGTVGAAAVGCAAGPSSDPRGGPWDPFDRRRIWDNDDGSVDGHAWQNGKPK